MTHNPIELELERLATLREQNPALATGWSITRYARGGVLVVSRIDPATRSELVEGFNAGSTSATVTVQTSTAGSWTSLLGTAAKRASDGAGKLKLTVPPVCAVLLKANGRVLSARPPKPTLSIAPDRASTMDAATATVGGKAPVSVAFAYRRGSGAWHRIDVDTSPPFRGFIEPWRFKKHERIQVVAIARGLDGRTAVSPVVTFSTP